MIKTDEINQKADEFKINPQDIEKDYVFGWVLKTLYSESALKDILILKGGNALRKAYFPNTRYSKDLDFSVQNELDENFFHTELNKLCKLISDQTGINFEINKTIVRPKDVPIPNTSLLEARIYFKGFYGEESISLKTQLDITQFDKIYLPIQNAPLIHPYSDSELCSTNIKCQKAEEILASKLDNLLHRKKVSDLFDLMHGIIFTKDFTVNKLEVMTTFLRRTIYESAPSSAKQQLQGVQLEEYRPFWHSLIAPFTSLFEFDSAVSNFNNLIDTLFESIPTIQNSVPAFAYSYGNVYRPNHGYSVIPEYFSSDTRETIINSGRSQKMIKMGYDGYERLVEPYSMEYYVRKDGIGSEYFWGFDNSGGKSNTLSIKRFFCNKIEFAKMTDLGFTPKYEIEF